VREREREDVTCGRGGQTIDCGVDDDGVAEDGKGAHGGGHGGDRKRARLMAEEV